jgi:hypothetical protein
VGLFPDNEKVDDNLDLVSDDVEVDGGGGKESWHSSGDEDEDAGRCKREGDAGASAPTDSRSRFLKHARGRRNASHQNAQEKAHYRSQDGGEFSRQGGQSFAAADDGRKDLASSMMSRQEAMVLALQNEYEKDRAAGSSVIASQAQNRDTTVSALGQLAAAV